MANMVFKIEGMEKLKADFEKIGKVPQKFITPAAKKGMNVVLKTSKANAPHDTWDLKKGIILAPEKSRFKGKKVYRVVFDRAYNDIFQKKNSDGKITGYYPISQEYGYFTRNGRYIPGYKFIHTAFENSTGTMERTIVNTMKQKIDQEIAKAGLK